jgi:GT2 family glycosyltransferase
MRDLGAVVLHWRFWPRVQPTIDALLGEGIDPRNVRIVDNASGDGSIDQIRSAYHRCDGILELPTNRGYAAGMNAGIRSLDAKDVLLLTHETVLRSGSLDLLRDRLAAHSETGIVGPLLTFRDDPATVFSEGGRFNRRMAISHVSAGEPVADHEHDGPRPVDWLDGSCLLIRREVFDTVGLFDERYFLYYEETDFMARTSRRGWRIEVVPSARAMQQPGSKSTALWVRNRLRFLRRNASTRLFLRQAIVDVCTSLQGPERRLTARGLFGYVLGADPRDLYGPSSGVTGAAIPPPSARPAQWIGDDHSTH